MRAAGNRWLPREEEESYVQYNLRLSRSFLYNAFGDTLTKLSTKPFTKPITVKNGRLGEKLALILYNADKQGSTLTSFAHEFFRDAVKYGVAYALVDYPTVPEGATLKYERDFKIAPYFVRIDPRDLISWTPAIDVSGRQYCTEIRFKEDRVEKDGEWGEKIVPYVRVYGESLIRTYRIAKGKEDEEIVAERRVNTLGKVPIVALYTRKTGFMTAQPPLEDLGWMNIAHWQSLSDQRNILRIARCGTAIFTGLSDDEKKEKLIVGGNRSLKFTSTDVKAFYLEHTGKGIEAGQLDIDKLEDRMQVLGLQPLIKSSSRVAASSASDSEQRTHSSIQTWVRLLSEALLEMFRLGAEWAKEPLPELFKIEVYSDFGLSAKAGLEMQTLLTARTAGEITRERFLKEFQRRNILADDLDITQEIKVLEAEDKEKQARELAAKKPIDPNAPNPAGN